MLPCLTRGNTSPFLSTRKDSSSARLRRANSSLGKTLHQAKEDVTSLQSETGKAARKIAEGEKVDMRDMMAAVEKARNSYDRLAEIRARMLEAYREILRKRTQA